MTIDNVDDGRRRCPMQAPLLPVFSAFVRVRHVTLSTGTLALGAARFGTSSFGKDWFYYAMAGIGVTFFLNLGVSFSIASFVALRAYDVSAREQLLLLRFLLLQVLRSPWKFILPVQRDTPQLTTLTTATEAK